MNDLFRCCRWDSDNWNVCIHVWLSGECYDFRSSGTVWWNMCKEQSTRRGESGIQRVLNSTHAPVDLIPLARREQRPPATSSRESESVRACGVSGEPLDAEASRPVSRTSYSHHVTAYSVYPEKVSDSDLPPCWASALSYYLPTAHSHKLGHHFHLASSQKHSSPS